jgi:hypothetical protein
MLPLRIVDPERKIQTIEEAPIPEIFLPFLSIQKAVEKMTDAAIPEILQLILKHPIAEISQIFHFLAILHNLRPHQHSQIAKLISHVSLVLSVPFSGAEVSNYPLLAFQLFQLGLLGNKDTNLCLKNSHLFPFLSFPQNVNELDVPKCYRSKFMAMGKDFPIDDIRAFGYEKETLEYFIKFDMFDGFQELVTRGDFDFHRSSFISPLDLPCNANGEVESLLSVAGFYGSPQCFKYLFFSGLKITSEATQWTVRGGNYDLIHFCELEKGDFTECLPIAVSYLRNDVADWFLKNFPVNEFTFKEAIESANIPAILFLYSNGYDLNELIIFMHFSFSILL